MSKNGLILLTPTSIAYTGTSATVSANGSVSFSAVSSLSLNGVFSADYDNYLVVARGEINGASGGQTWRYRLRASGTDNTTASSYTVQFLYVDSTTVIGNRYTNNFAQIIGAYDGNEVGFACHFYGPYLTQPTAVRPVGVNSKSGAGIYDFASTHNQSTSYDGLTFTTDATSLSGRVAVYGMRK
jgi:hypothetical protein